MRQFIRMGEYQIEVSYGYHVRERLMARFTDIDIPYFNFILSNIFSDPAVADYLINDVRVGEDVVIVDEDSGVAIAANVGTDCIYLKTIFNAYEGNMLVGEMQKVVRYAKETGARMEAFVKRRKESYA